MCALSIRIAGFLWGYVGGEPFDRGVTCAALVGLAFVYVKLENTRAKLVFSGMEVLAGIWSSYYEISKLEIEGKHPDIHGRLALIAGGVVVMAHGMKHLMKALEKPTPTPTPQSNQSSEDQDPD
jgi:hypothetical protein